MPIVNDATPEPETGPGVGPDQSGTAQGDVAPSDSAGVSQPSRVRAVRWAHIFMRGGFAFAVAFIVFGILAGWMAAEWNALPAWLPELLWGTLTTLTAIGIAIHASRTFKEPTPTLEPPDRSLVEMRLQKQADGLGWDVGAKVTLVASFVVFIPLAVITLRTSGTAAEVPDWVGWMTVFFAFAVGSSAGWFAVREYRTILERQSPRRTLASDLAERAVAVQKAMQQAATLVDDFQEDITIQQRVLTEIQRQVTDYQQAAAISKAEAKSVAKVLAADQRRDRRRSFWSGLAVNVMVGFVFYVLGVLTPALLDAEALVDLLRRWFRLG